MRGVVPVSPTLAWSYPKILAAPIECCGFMFISARGAYPCSMSAKASSSAPPKGSDLPELSRMKSLS